MFAKKACGAAGEVIRGILFLGFCVQIALGLAWMCLNFAHVQDFAPAAGGVYPGMLRLSGGLYPAVYALQLGAALGAGLRLLGRLWTGKKVAALWGSLALVTLPMAMQCHLALLPYSLVCSAGLLQLSFFCDCLSGVSPSEGGKRETGDRNSAGRGRKFGRPALAAGIAGVLSCFLLQALLLPEYLLLGAVPTAAMLAATLAGAKRGRRAGFGRLCAVSLSAAAAAWLLAAGASEAEALGAERAPAEVSSSASHAGGESAEQSDISGVEWTLAKRVCWPTFWVDSDGLPERIREAAGDVLWETSCYPDNMDRVFRPALEAALSAEEAKTLLREMTQQAWEMHWPMVVRQLGWDVLGYGMTPAVLPLQLAGEAYESHSGRNYEIMRNRAPVLTRRYVNYGCRWFVAAAALTAPLALFRLLSGEKPYARRDAAVFAAALLAAGCAVCWYTLQGAGIMDYKYTISVNELWILWSLKTLGERSRNGEEGGQG